MNGVNMVLGISFIDSRTDARNPTPTDVFAHGQSVGVCDVVDGHLTRMACRSSVRTAGLNNEHEGERNG